MRSSPIRGRHVAPAHPRFHLGDIIAPRRRAVTLVLAVLCRQKATDLTPNAVIVVSDQLISEGGTDEQHDAPQLKAVKLWHGITAFVAGDLNMCQRVCAGAYAELRWDGAVSVARAAQRVATHVQYAITQDFERSLIRYKTNLASLLDGTASLAKPLRNRLLRQYRALTPGVQFLIVGVDPTGAHIWYVDGGGAMQIEDPWSFSAIGSGADHARRVLKQASYQWSWLPGEALGVAFLAKRAAEMDAWVGHERTSVIVITRELNNEATAEEKAHLAAGHDAYSHAIRNGFAAAKVAGDRAALSLFAPRQLPDGVEGEAPQSPSGSTRDP